MEVLYPLGEPSAVDGDCPIEANLMDSQVVIADQLVDHSQSSETALPEVPPEVVVPLLLPLLTIRPLLVTRV